MRKSSIAKGAALGREAVEILLRSTALGEMARDDNGRRALYLGAVRVLMRLVVVIEAEKRRLFPVDAAAYRDSYSLGGLLEVLSTLVGEDPDAAANRHTAWPRLTALSRLIWSGSPHGELPMRAYGGELFEPGDPLSASPERRAVAVFEDPAGCSDDLSVHRMLTLLVAAARAAGEVETRLVGALYEGLTDGALEGSEASGWRVGTRAEGRKRGGIFYTPQALADGTVEKCLRPLCRVDSALVRPEQILALRVCDPAMGSGSFLVSALRFLVRELVASLKYHGRLTASDLVASPRPQISLATQSTVVRLSQEITFELPCAPGAPETESMLAAHVSRHVVENCLHGVDVDPVAVELAKVSLWIETMDPRLPFTFLDHKLKCGDSLVGCGLDDVCVYPLAAWRAGAPATGRRRRSGGTDPAAAGAANGAHGTIDAGAPSVRRELEGLVADLRSPMLPLFAKPKGIRALQAEMAMNIREIQRVPVQLPDRKRRIYEAGITLNPRVQALRRGLDRWCALWFWPDSERTHAPGPSAYYRDSEAGAKASADIAARLGFFHWEIEFPEVFSEGAGGFHAVIGNPPWDEVKREDRQGALSNWYSCRARPAGNLEAQVRKLARLPRTLPERPFVHQGSASLNLYKLFLEQSYCLCRDRGRIAMVVPAGLYGDRGASQLRKLLLERCSMEWLYGFENREEVFPIDSRFKFCVVVAQKGGTTSEVRTRFLRRNPAEWAEESPECVKVSPADLRVTSPRESAFLEVSSERKLALVTRLCAVGQTLSPLEKHSLQAPEAVLPLRSSGPRADCWGARFVREHDMSDPAHAFRPVEWWEERGFVPGPDFVWRRGRESALPLYQGAMIGILDFAKNGWDRNSGSWKLLPRDAKAIRPRLLVAAGAPGSCHDDRRMVIEGGAKSDAPTTQVRTCKLVVRRIARNTDERTVIPAIVPDFPCGDKAAVLETESMRDSLALAAVLSSMVVDFAARAMVAGTNLDWHHIQRLPLPPRTDKRAIDFLALCALRLNCLHPIFSGAWAAMKDLVPGPWWGPFRSECEEFLLRSAVEAVVADLFGLNVQDFETVVADCDHPVEKLVDPAFRSTLDPQGFWRVDRCMPPSERLTVQAMEAFTRLRQVGLDGFLSEAVGRCGLPRSVAVTASCSQRVRALNR